MLRIRWSSDTHLACAELQEIFKQAKPTDFERSSHLLGETMGGPLVSLLSVNLGIHTSEVSPQKTKLSLNEDFATFSPPERSCNPVPQNSMFAEWPGKHNLRCTELTRTVSVEPFFVPDYDGDYNCDYADFENSWTFVNSNQPDDESGPFTFEIY